MSTYRLSPLAEIDLECIWLYTLERWSVTQADSYYADIIEAIEKLASGERQGLKANVRDGYQKYAVRRHFVFFHMSNIGVDVIRVLHQSMDCPSSYKMGHQSGLSFGGSGSFV